MRFIQFVLGLHYPSGTIPQAHPLQMSLIRRLSPYTAEWGKSFDELDLRFTFAVQL